MKKTLIVDDNSEVLELLLDMLAIEGCEIFSASSAFQAGKLFKANAFDLAIVDMLLPDRSGIELIKDFWKQTPDLKVIAITGGGKLGPKGYLNMAERIGVEHRFAKPFDIPELLRVVKGLLQSV